MQTDMKAKALTRISFAFLMVGLLAGGLFIKAQADAQPVDNPDETGAEEAAPEKTAYVDFLYILKEDTLLAKRQQELAVDLQTSGEEINSRYEPKIKEQQKIKQDFKPNTWQYRKAMEKQLDLERERYEELLTLEQFTQSDLRDYGIKRFKEIRNLVIDIAKEKGYTEVLNIVRNIEEVAGAQEDFQALQQQLLVSPVLLFDEKHDITDAVYDKADELWGTDIALPEDITYETAGAAVARNKDGEIEIRLGSKGQFKVNVTEKGETVPEGDEKAEVRWYKYGLNVGSVDEDDGTYTAPDKFPAAGDTFTVSVYSRVDPKAKQEVTIRLLDKDGKPMPEKGTEDGSEDGQD